MRHQTSSPRSSVIALTAALAAMLLAGCGALPSPTATIDASAGIASAAGTPTSRVDLYDPTILRGFHVRLSEADYETIRYDDTFDVKVPALFWFEDEEPVERSITIRRKSATPIGDKISYRVAFSQTVFGVKSFSLENGDDTDVVSEGLAWYLHRLAATDTYQPGLAAWATLTLHVERRVPLEDENGEPLLHEETGEALYETIIDVRPQGVYLNVELPDKRFLQNRGLWDSATTWLYKQDDTGLPELKEPEDGVDSYLYDTTLRFSPFREVEYTGRKVSNPPPSDPELERIVRDSVDVDGWLRLAAVNAWTDNPDELFNKGKNFFWADFDQSRGLLRRYYPWDLDAVIRSREGGIYGTVTSGRKGSIVSQHPYQEHILNHPKFRTEYNALFLTLLDGPLSTENLQAALTTFQALLTDALEADPNRKFLDVAGHFDELRAWVAAREASIRRQIAANNTPRPRADYGTFSIVTVDRAGEGSGAVRSEPAGIDCGDTCSATFEDGTTVTLRAEPAPGSLFEGWSGACSGTSTCTIVVNGATTAVATFISGPAPTTVRLSAFQGSSVTAKRSWSATASPTITNLGDSAVSGAEVVMRWSGAVTGSGSCTTDSTGRCSLTLSGLKTSSSTVTFEIVDVRASGAAYEAASNLASAVLVVTR
jgi:hypothetical protein